MDVADTLKDIVYITVGLGILAFNRTQVRRRELARQLGPEVEGLVSSVDGALAPVRDQLGELLEQAEERFGEQAREAVRTARALARESEQQIRRAARRPADQ